LHRLYSSERWPIRKIERHLRMSWRTTRRLCRRCAIVHKSAPSPKVIAQLAIDAEEDPE
jgi:hypothetical protein